MKNIILLLLNIFNGLSLKVLHKTTTVPSNWKYLNIPKYDEIMNFRILLPQQNIDILETELIFRTDTETIYYTEWLSNNYINSIVRTDETIVTNVNNWLSSENIHNCQTMSDSIYCSTTVLNINEVFHTNILRYSEVNTGSTFLSGRERGMYIPEHLRIELILGIVDFPQLKYKNYNIYDLKPISNDESYITPISIRSLYNIPKDLKHTRVSSQSVVEFVDDNCFNIDDLNGFITDNNLKSLKLINILGDCNYSTLYPDIEATLDIQYQIGTNLNTMQYYVSVSEWLYEYANEMYNLDDPPMVNSMSYGWAEWDQCDPEVFPGCYIGGDAEVYTKRTNIEFMKIGLRGITLLASSGDAGASGRTNENCDSNIPLNPVFPTSSPWVFSIGGNIVLNSTVFENSTVPLCEKNKCIKGGYELNCNNERCGWCAGGGFSNYFNRPWWQANHSDIYLNSSIPFPPNIYFNKQGRVYPDISLVAHNYLIKNSGEYRIVDGTSASSPVMSGMISILNNLRLSINKSVLGPIGPLFYTMYNNCEKCFKDITEGNNNSTEMGDCKYGYTATKGYDAVYGLGTPNFAEIYNYVKNM